jgi:hypothetical protein
MRKKRRSSPTGTLPKYQTTATAAAAANPPTAGAARRRRASEPSPLRASAAAAGAPPQPPPPPPPLPPHQSAPFRAWLRSYRDVSAALRRRLAAAGWEAENDDDGGDDEGEDDTAAVAALVDAAGGLLVLDNFLPPLAAEGVASALASLPEAAWAATGARQDAARNDIDHFFHSTKGQNVAPRQAGEAAAAQVQGAAEAAGEGRPAVPAPPPLPAGLRGLDPAAAAAAAEAAVRLLPQIFRALSLLLPGALHTFSAARYGPGHCIAPHDDRAYTRVRLLPTGQQGQEEEEAAGAGAGVGAGAGKGGGGGGGGGEIVECSRTLAVIYYASETWRPEWGGALVDLEATATAAGGAGSRDPPGAAAAARRAAAAAGVDPPLPASARVLAPAFNRLVAFRVPRYHQVTPVLPCVGAEHRRYSVFGWFLEPGRLYPLHTGEEEEEEGEEAAAAAAGGAGKGGGGGARRGARGGGGGAGRGGGRVSRASAATTATDDSGGEGWLQPGSS